MAELLTESNFYTQTSEGVTLVDIYADWCGPCRLVSPIIDEMANEATDYKVYKVDADQNKSILNDTGVRSIPTILVYKDGEIVERHVGAASKAQLTTLVEKHV